MNGLPRCTTGSPNFLTECSQQPQLANLLNGCLDSTMFGFKQAVGSLIVFLLSASTHELDIPP